MRPMRTCARQDGATLVVGLVMLVMLTLMTLSAFMLSSGNLTAVGNMQFRDEALNAANYAIEQVISADFTVVPAASTITVDVDRDGADDYTVSVPTPSCLRWRVIPTSELDVTSADDLNCFSGGSTGSSGLGGTASTDSFCADTLWEVAATLSTDTGASADIKQGITKRMSKVVAENSCD